MSMMGRVYNWRKQAPIRMGEDVYLKKAGSHKNEGKGVYLKKAGYHKYMMGRVYT